MFIISCSLSITYITFVYYMNNNNIITIIMIMIVIVMSGLMSVFDVALTLLSFPLLLK